MNPQSARALVWLAGIFLLLGMMVGTPPGAVAMLVLSACCVVVPVIRGPRGPRVAGITVLALALALAFAQFPAAVDHMRAYQKQGRDTHEVESDRGGDRP